MLFEKIKSEPVVEQLKIGLLAASRVAAEHKRLGATVDASEYWHKCELLLKELINISPYQAIEFAHFLTHFPYHINVESEWSSQWLRVYGLYVIGSEELQQQIIDFLTINRNGVKLLHTLTKYSGLSVGGMSRREVLSTPECYGKFVALSAILSFKFATENPDILHLVQKAEKELNYPEVVQVLKYYEDIPDAQHFVMALKSHIVG